MQHKTFSRLLDRRRDSHKYDYGHVLVIGGSPGMVGAPLLAGKAALRTGAGLVTIASTSEVTDKLEKRVEEIMTLALPADTSGATSVLQEFVKDRRVSVVVVGPGLKPGPYSAALIKQLVQYQMMPIIIDGGGLGALQSSLDLLKGSTSSAVILTPHFGEFERLVGRKLPDKRPELKPIAISFAKEHKVTLVLKGRPTYVTHPSGSLYENTTGNPGLATAGTGDVLSGIIAGIISQGIEPNDASEAAVYLHGLAGDIAATEKTEPGMIASDVIEAIPAALKYTEHATF